jgi:5-methylcytosine-specific restriction enzyme B
MIQADLIRQFAFDHFVAPGRAALRSEVMVRAGDVHQAMGLANAMPAVCSAIGSNKLPDVAQVKLVAPASQSGLRGVLSCVRTADIPVG